MGFGRSLVNALLHSARYSLPGLADDGDEDVAVADDGEGDDDGHHHDLAPPHLVVRVHC